VLGLLAGMLLAATFVGGGAAKAGGHLTGLETLVIGPTTEVDYTPKARSSNTVVWFYGSGFTPGATLGILVLDGPGTGQDITFGAKPWPLIVNDEGAFAIAWKIHRFTRSRGGVGPGDGDAERMKTVWVIDEDYNNLAAAPMAFCNLSKRGEDEKAPSHCSG